MLESLTKKGNVGERMDLGGGVEMVTHSPFTFEHFYFETPEGNNQVGEQMALARLLSLF